MLEFRNLLERLSHPSVGESKCLTVFSRLDSPFLVQLQNGAVTIVFPIWVKSRQNAILTTAFIRVQFLLLLSPTLNQVFSSDDQFSSACRQEFAEARRQSSLSNVPECSMTFPGVSQASMPTSWIKLILVYLYLTRIFNIS